MKPSTNRCDGMNCTSHSQCTGWCEKVYDAGAVKHFKCQKALSRDIRIFVMMIVCGILLSIAYFLYYKFIKLPANKNNQKSGSPKG
jgi:hypothetical protein